MQRRQSEPSSDDLLILERELWRSGRARVAGVDEAGRGPLAGPVVSAAVVFSPQRGIPMVVDSKLLSEKQRAEAFAEILSCAVDWKAAAASVKLIDRCGIARATMLSMRSALMKLNQAPDYALIDGTQVPERLPFPVRAVVDGDARSRTIAAASIVAKVVRDRLMMNLARIYPQWGFERNKGYGTPAHIELLHKGAFTPHHRFSFAPLKQQRLLLD